MSVTDEELAKQKEAEEERDHARERWTAWQEEAHRCSRALLQAKRRIQDADSFLADPAGNPIDAINLARSALSEQQEDERA